MSNFAAHHKLSNLLVIVDANGLQGFGKTKDVIDMEPFADKWRAFGWDTKEIDGHDFDALRAACGEPDANKPRCVIARTSKGKGVRFMEGKLEWHYLPMNEAQFTEAMLDIEATS